MDWLLQPWPWYVSGPLIGLMVPALLLLAGKSFGVSSSFRHIGAACAPRLNLRYLRNYNWRDHSWNLLFVAGIVLGGFIGNFVLSAEPMQFLPDDYASPRGAILLLVGGVLVGFGTRYAGGCTSGHTIMGISNLRWPSLVATIFFFVGGLTTVWVLRPLFGF